MFNMILRLLPMHRSTTYPSQQKASILVGDDNNIILRILVTYLVLMG